METASRTSWLRYFRGLAPPVLVLLLLMAGLGYALFTQATLYERTDEDNVREWLTEARVFGGKNLPELLRERGKLVHRVRLAKEQADQAAAEEAQGELYVKHEEIHEQLKALGTPPKIYPGQFPLFPVIYRLEVRVPNAKDAEPTLIAWDSDLPRPARPLTREGRVRTLEPAITVQLDGDLVGTINLDYHLHAFSRRQRDEAARQETFVWLGGIGLLAVALALAYVYFFLRREREREMQKFLAQQQVEHERAEKLTLENELRKQEVESKEMERKLLQREVETRKAEQEALEVRSQLFASIGIMAGSYAHNIKNLLVRPNELLRRCMEADGLQKDQRNMLEEVGETLGTVTERLQQILKTVRRDPTKSEREPLDLNNLVEEMHRNWWELAETKWKLSLRLELAAQPLPIQGDQSHLIQALENLLFNARDATFEKRALVRAQVRSDRALNEDLRRQALIAASGWRGEVTLRTLREGNNAVIEVADNGIGMEEGTRLRCCEPHFSTKRDNALHEGNSVGMGLGLSFVQAILQHHSAVIEILSTPGQGSIFRLLFPLAMATEAVTNSLPQKTVAVTRPS